MTTTTVAPPRDGRAPSLAGHETALYLRVSTVEQAEEGISLDAQGAELRRLAEQRWPDAPIVLYREEGKSAREGKRRPEYDRLCDRVAAGHVRSILAVERSRLARSVTEWLTLRKLCAEHSVHLETLNGGTEDTTTATGRLIGTILAAVAEFESDLKSERVKRATTYLQTNGLWHGGSLPLTLTVSPERVLCATEQTAHIGEAFRLLVDEGWSVKRVARFLGDRLGRPISPTAATRILRNEHYAGWIVQGDKLIEGEHEQFVPRDLWHRAQAILDKKQAEGTRHPRRNPFGAVARCYCGGRLERHLQSSGKYVALRCERRKAKACDAPYIPVENLEAAVVSVLAHAHADLAASLDHPKWTWYATSADTEPERRERMAEVTTELADVEARQQRLYDAYEEGTIDRDKYLERARALNDRRAGLDAQRAELTRDDTAVRADLEALRDELAGHGADLPEGPRPIALWLTSPFEQRDELIRSTIDKIELSEARDGAHALTVTFRAGPQLTAYVANRRDPQSATWRELGFGLCVSEPRAPPTSPPPFAFR